MFLKGFEGWHILIIVGLLVVLFGARKLPDSARSIGQSLRIFKSEMKAAGQDGDAEQDGAATRPDQPTSPRPALEHASVTPGAENSGTGAIAGHATMTHIAGKDATEFEAVPR
jgi:sec-independent protein translocase protein TatA